MAQIRNTIELFTKILRENGISKTKAETFRLAKFNRDESVAAMWQLLFELIYYCQYGRVDEVAVKAASEFTSEELVIFVKHEMQDRGFCSRDFAALPTDKSNGSRELLLAIGWLICKEHILDRFMLNCTSPLDSHSTLYDGDEEAEHDETPLTARTAHNPTERVQQLLSVNNKLRMNLRSLYALQKQKHKLMHNVHEATQGVSLSLDKNHLTVLEVYMLRHPEMLKKNLQLLEKDNERLKNLLSWRDHEDIFWKWMESVLDLKLQETINSEDDSSVAVASVSDIPQISLDRLQETHLNLHEAIVKYEAIVDYIERLWEIKSDAISEEELDSVLASIDLELSIQRATIALCNTEEYLQRHQIASDFKYEKNKQQISRPKVSVQNQASSEQSQGSDTWKEIEGEIILLQKTMDQLNEEIRVRQNQYKGEIQELSQKFRSSICIPPMNKKKIIV